MKVPVDLRRSIDADVVDHCDVFEVLGPGALQFTLTHPIAERFPAQPGHPNGTYRTDDSKPSFVCGVIMKCPGCGESVALGFKNVYTAGDAPFRPDHYAHWDWNLDKEKPTLTPSIVHDPSKGGCGWHGHLRNGVFQAC